MADTKISNLAALAAAPDTNDVFALVDTTAGSTKKLEAKYLVRDSGGSGAIVTGASGAYTLTIPATGTAALLATANVFAEIVTASKGIAFPATQVASVDAHTLDDYEEGVWTTPTILFGGANVGMEFDTLESTYTKFGNLVTARMLVILSAKGSSTGIATVGGLPFTVSGHSVASVWAYSLSYTGMLISHASNAQTTCVIQQITEAGTTSNLTDANFINTTRLYLNVSYKV